MAQSIILILRILEAALRHQHEEKLEIANVRLNLRRKSVEQQYDALVKANDLQMTVRID